MSEAHIHQEAPSIPFEDLPQRMKRSRKRMGWDQEDIAPRLGVHPRTVANYETGKTEPKLALLMAWANLTNVPLDWLTFGAEPCSCGETRSRCFCASCLAGRPEDCVKLAPKPSKLEGQVFYPSFDAPRNKPARVSDGGATILTMQRA